MIDSVSQMQNEARSYIEWIKDIHRELCISDGWECDRHAPMFLENSAIIHSGLDMYGRGLYLAKACSQAWLRMQLAARRDGLGLCAVSGFRSVLRQRDIIKRKLERGQQLTDILKVNAPPGYSQHHTGCALDLADDSSSEPLSEQFERLPVFRWLLEHAPSFGFVMQYPRENIYGFVYEPWHWAMDTVHEFALSTGSSTLDK